MLCSLSLHISKAAILSSVALPKKSLILSNLVDTISQSRAMLLYVGMHLV